MTLRMTRLLLILFVLAALVGTVQAQGAPPTFDFSQYVALGDSLTAGYRSGGLGTQQNSYPALLHNSFHNGEAPAPFEQPLVSAPGIPNQLQLTGLFPTVIEPLPGSGVPLNLFLERPYDNLGIPGAEVEDLLSTVSSEGNPFYDLILRNGEGGFSAAEQALGLEPTFLSLWIGNNDALGAATAGNPDLLTPLDEFTNSYTQLIGLLALSGAPMVVANIPNVMVIPFVDTISPILVDPATNEPVLDGEGNFIPLFYCGEGGPLPLSPTSKVLLTAGPLLGVGCGIPFPLGLVGSEGPFPEECPFPGALPDYTILTDSQQTRINDRVAEYNEVILARAMAVGAAHWDAHAAFSDIAIEGVEIGGINFNADFLTGGLFSYDGVHPSEIGYGVVANFFVETVNAHFGSSVPMVDLRDLFFGTGDPPPPIETSAEILFSAEATAGLYDLFGVSETDLRSVTPGVSRRDLILRRGAPGSRPSSGGLPAETRTRSPRIRKR